MHKHDAHCGCEHSRVRECHSHGALSEAQHAFLHELERHHYLPVARFLVESSREDDFSSVALAPVYLRSPAESMEQVKETGVLLLELEERRLLTLDYDLPLEGYPYEEYKNSQLYAFFCKTVEEGRDRPGFLGDTPVLELGSIAPRAVES